MKHTHTYAFTYYRDTCHSPYKMKNQLDHNYNILQHEKIMFLLVTNAIQTIEKLCQMMISLLCCYVLHLLVYCKSSIIRTKKDKSCFNRQLQKKRQKKNETDDFNLCVTIK